MGGNTTVAGTPQGVGADVRGRRAVRIEVGGLTARPEQEAAPDHLPHEDDGAAADGGPRGDDVLRLPRAQPQEERLHVRLRAQDRQGRAQWGAQRPHDRQRRAGDPPPLGVDVIGGTEQGDAW
eukprot:8786533-Pyramimonas_sp.AAC.2